MPDTEIPTPARAGTRPASGAAWLALALAAIVLGVALQAGPSEGARAADRVAAPQQASASPSPSPTFEPWVPTGTWRVVHSAAVDPLWRGDGPVLRGVHLARDADEQLVGWAVGDEGALARLTDGKWAAVTDFDPRTTNPMTYHFRDVFVKAPDDVWLVGMVEGDRNCDGCGTVIHYDGRRFRELDRYEYRVNGRMGPLNAIDMLQDENGDWYGWAVGDDADFDRFKAMILRYTPDGLWRVWSAHNIAKHLYDVRLVSPTEAWAVGQDGVESRYNEEGGGGLWPPLGRSGADTLYAVDLTDPLHGWDGGFRGRMNKYRGHCHDDDPNTTCWFQNEAIPLRTENGSQWAITIRGIDLIDRNQGWLVGVASGRISTVAYQSDADDWTLVSVEGDPGKDLHAIQMVDGRLGYAVGEGGVILRYFAVAPVSPTPTRTPTRTVTPAPTASPTGTEPATATAGPTPTVTVTVAPTEASATPEPSPTASPSATRGTAEPSPTEDATATGPTVRLYLPLMSNRR